MNPQRPIRMLVAAAAVAGVSAVCPVSAAPDYLGVLPPKVASAPKVIAKTCAACHGKRGVATAPIFPNLAGQNYNYLLKSLEAFRQGTWNASPMNAMVKMIPDSGKNGNLKLIAAYFSGIALSSKGAPADLKPNKAAVEAGYKLYFQGKPGAHIPACAACHMASGMGDAPMAVPRLAGQNALYVETQLKAFASGQRRTSPDHVMGKIAKRLSSKQIHVVAGYVQAMRPNLLPGRGPKSYAVYAAALKQQPVPGVPASALQGAAGK